MAEEVFIRIKGKSLTPYRSRVVQAITGLPSYVRQAKDGEWWLKDPGSRSDWPFDARLFLQGEALFVELTAPTGQARHDLRQLVDNLTELGQVEIVDEDDNSVDLDWLIGPS